MATNPARKKINPTQSAESPINVIKEATCPTSTGKSTLGYLVGIDDKGDALFKLTMVSGGGRWRWYVVIQRFYRFRADNLAEPATGIGG